MIAIGIVNLKSKVIWMGRIKIYRKIRNWINIHAITSKIDLSLRKFILTKYPLSTESIRYISINIPKLEIVIKSGDADGYKNDTISWNGIISVRITAKVDIIAKNEIFLMYSYIL